MFVTYIQQITMKKIKLFILLIAFCSSAIVASAQDIITLKSGDEIKAKVQEIGIDDVKYKKFENLAGPTYTLRKTDIFMIRYENGEKDVFAQNSNLPQKGTEDNRTAPTQATPVVQSQPQPQPQEDAKESAATQTVLSALVGVQNPDDSYSPPQLAKKPGKVKFGIQLGGVMSNMNSVDYSPGGWYEDWEVSPKIGFSAGVLLEIKLAKMFSIQPGLSFTMKGCMREGYTNLVHADDETPAYEDAYEEWSLNTSYLEVPLHFVFNIPMKENCFHIGLGPYAAYGMTGQSKSHFTYDGESMDDEMVDSALKFDLFSGRKKLYEPLDWGLDGFVGVTFSDSFFVKAGYSHGMANISADTDEEESVKNNHFYVSLGLKF